MNISQGFQTSTSETVLFVVILAIAIVGLVIYQLVGQRSAGKRRKQKRRAAGDGAQQPILKSRSRSRRDLIKLSRSEERTLDHLAWLLKDPGRRDRLIDDDRLISRVARQAIREGLVTEQEVLMLMRKLEVDTFELRVGSHSSESIPNGADVSISDRNLNIAGGTVLLSDEHGLRIRLDKTGKALTSGSSVEVVAGADEGLFRFHTAIIARSGKEATLRHSKHVERVQRRRYRRRSTKIPVEIRIPGIDEKVLSSETRDLSIGGAALKNPRKRIVTGTRLDLVVDAGGSSPVSVSGLAVRSSQRGKTIHISFEKVNDETRHKLFRKIIRLEQGRR